MCKLETIIRSLITWAYFVVYRFFYCLLSTSWSQCVSWGICARSWMVKMLTASQRYWRRGSLDSKWYQLLFTLLRFVFGSWSQFWSLFGQTISVTSNTSHFQHSTSLPQLWCLQGQLWWIWRWEPVSTTKFKRDGSSCASTYRSRWSQLYRRFFLSYSTSCCTLDCASMQDISFKTTRWCCSTCL